MARRIGESRFCLSTGAVERRGMHLAAVAWRQEEGGARGYMNDQPIWLTFVVAFIIMNELLIGMAYMTYFERKVLAAMQDRLGPTRTGPKGLLLPIADGISSSEKRT